MTPMIYLALALAALLLVHLVLVVRLMRSPRVAAPADERVAHLTAALALLTDTTEEGFVSVATELQRLGARPLPSVSTRRATTKRITAAVRKGRAVEDVAIAESLSESEVRLHLGLGATVTGAPRGPVPAAETPTPGAHAKRPRPPAPKTARAHGGRRAAVRA